MKNILRQPTSTAFYTPLVYNVIKGVIGMVFYIDVAVFSSFIINLLCLDTAKRIFKIPKRNAYIFFGSLLLSVLSVACFFVANIRIVYIFLYFGIITLIFGRCRFAEAVRRVGRCICTSLLYGALMLSFVPADRLWIANGKSGAFFVPEDIYFYAPLALIYIAVRLILFLVSNKKRVFSVKLVIDGQTAVADAIVDTGNSLRDRETLAPVIIAERSLFGDISVVPKIIGYRNIGAERGFTKIYPVEKMYLTEEHKEYENLYAAFVERPLSEKGRYRVLLNNSFDI